MAVAVDLENKMSTMYVKVTPTPILNKGPKLMLFMISLLFLYFLFTFCSLLMQGKTCIVK